MDRHRLSIRRGVLRALCLFAVCLFARAAESPGGAEAFFMHPEIRSAAVSPSGQYVALVKRMGSGRYAVVVLSAGHPGDARVIAGFRDIDCVDALWVNDERLTFATANLEGNDDDRPIPGRLYGVNRDGGEIVELIPPKTQQDAGVIERFQFRPMAGIGTKSNSIIVGKFKGAGADGHLDHIAPFTMDTTTSVLTPLVKPGLPEHATGWLFDTEGAARVFTALRAGRRIVYYRVSVDAQWEKIGDFDAAKLEGFFPSFFGYDDALYATRTNADGYFALYRYDERLHRLDSEPTMQVAGFDYMGFPMMDPVARKDLGFRFLSDAWGTVWLDPAMKTIQQAVDTALPGTANQIVCANCLDAPVLLIAASSDRTPRRFYLFTRATDQVVLLSAAYPALDGRPMGRREYFTFRARDGLSIPVYVTFPPEPTSSPRPAVVLVHGGPWVRGSSWEWSAGPQFLASKGYVVIEPEFRGGRGFGYAFFQAGWRQWGLSMQDDIADAARWAAEQGYADPDRIAIGGASYGGYATLMGLVKNPELFRCGFEWLGVTDIKLLYTETWSDATFEQLQYGMPVLIGDPEKDSTQLNETSPLQNARRITQPLLMAYGGRDFRVPLADGEKMRTAVSATNKNVEWIEYEEEGHGWSREKDDIDFWNHVGRFLATHLKGAP